MTRQKQIQVQPKKVIQLAFDPTFNQDVSGMEPMTPEEQDAWDWLFDTGDIMDDDDDIETHMFSQF